MNVTTTDQKKCPSCAEMVNGEAKKCKHCGSALEKPVSVLLGLGILIAPYIFAWLTLASDRSAKARKISFAWLLVFVLAQAPILFRNKSQSDKTTAQNKNITVPKNPYKMELKLDAEAAQIDSEALLTNLLYAMKSGNRMRIYNAIKTSEDTAGARCGTDICTNLAIAMRSLKSSYDSQGSKFYEEMGTTKSYLAEAHKGLAAFKLSDTYKVANRPGKVDKANLSAFVHKEVRSRKECKRLGDAVHLAQRVPLVYFSKANIKLDRAPTSVDGAEKLSCYYKYNADGSNTYVYFGKDEITSAIKEGK